MGMVVNVLLVSLATDFIVLIKTNANPFKMIVHQKQHGKFKKISIYFLQSS